MEAVLWERVQSSMAMHCYSNAAFLGERLCASAPSDVRLPPSIPLLLPSTLHPPLPPQIPRASF